MERRDECNITYLYLRKHNLIQLNLNYNQKRILKKLLTDVIEINNKKIIF